MCELKFISLKLQDLNFALEENPMSRNTQSGNTASSRDYAMSQSVSGNNVSGFDSDGSPEPALRLPRRGPEAKKGLYLDRSQLVVFWSAIAGMMVFVFVTGFHAGRNQGREALLESASGEAVRLPIVATERTQVASVGSQSAKDDTKFDFAGSVALKKQLPKTNSSKKVEVVKKKTVSTNGIAPGWYIQVEAAKTESELNTIKERFSSKGLSPIVHKGKIRNEIFYQVVLGPYASRALAGSARKRVKEQGLSRIEPFVRRF